MSVVDRLLGEILNLAAVQGESDFWMPVEASSGAAAVDRIFTLIFWVSAFFFAVIVGLMVLFVLRYRRRQGREEAEPSPTHSTALEVTWTIIPFLITVVIFVWGFKVYLDLNLPPAHAYEVQVTGQKWKWLFTYPNGHVDESLHVPLDTPVRLVMTSEDVIHGFFVPAFRLKKDVVPGRYVKVWFRAVTAGRYPVYCTQYCGTGHSDMWSEVVVHPPGGFERWLEDAGNLLKSLPPAQAGEMLYRTRGCAQCHSVDGTGSTGPSWKGLFGRRVPLAGGQAADADEDYIRESTLDPQAKVVAGFEPVMPTYKGRLSDQEISALIAFIKTLEE